MRSVLGALCLILASLAIPLSANAVPVDITYQVDSGSNSLYFNNTEIVGGHIVFRWNLTSLNGSLSMAPGTGSLRSIIFANGTKTTINQNGLVATNGGLSIGTFQYACSLGGFSPPPSCPLSTRFPTVQGNPFLASAFMFHGYLNLFKEVKGNMSIFSDVQGGGAAIGVEIEHSHELYRWVVPEPSTAALVVLGLFGFTAGTRRLSR